MRRADVIGFAMGPALNALIGLLSIPLIAWIYAPEDVARFGLFQLTINSLLLFATLGLDQALVREYNETPDRTVLLKNCLTPCLATLALIGIIAIANMEAITEALFSSNQTILGYLTLATAFLLCVHRFATQLVRMKGRGILYSAAELVTKLTHLAIMAIALVVETLRQAAFLMFAYLLAFVASTAILTMSERSTWRQALSAPIRMDVMKPLLAFGTPLIAAGLAYWALTASGSLFIKWTSTLGELAKYSVTLSISNVAQLVQAVFVLIWTPIVYQWIADGVKMEALETVARRMLAVVCLFFMFAGLASGFVNLILPAHYGDIGQLLPSCLVLPLLYTLSEVTGIGIAVTRRTSLSIVVSLCALLVNVLTNFLFTPTYGAGGAAAASAVSGLIFFLTRSELSARVWRPILRIRLYLSATLLTAMAIVPAFWPQFATPLVWLTGAAAVAITFRAELSGSLQWLGSFRQGAKDTGGG